ncbi:hypothetical protein H113_06902 [Trichophyton rubrum MR1459]|nr:hypothetical protein H104_06807 [Trichophyton rubrum CBS 289.86]EZF92301.1 hypothetical protein H113_06902 [Trichophyton rubrum MR1459]
MIAKFVLLQTRTSKRLSGISNTARLVDWNEVWDTWIPARCRLSGRGPSSVPIWVHFGLGERGRSRISLRMIATQAVKPPLLNEPVQRRNQDSLSLPVVIPASVIRKQELHVKLNKRTLEPIPALRMS